MLETATSRVLYEVGLSLDVDSVKEKVHFAQSLLNNFSVIAIAGKFLLGPYVFTHTSFIIITEVFLYFNN